MALEPSLTLIHQTRLRWRFRVNVPKKIFDWYQFRDELKSIFPTSRWSVRVNPTSASVVVHRVASAPQLQGNSSLLVQTRLIQTLSRLGIKIPDTPLTPVEVVHPEQKLNLRSVRRLLVGFANLASASLSLSALILSVGFFIIGLIGLFIPFAPGLWLIMLGTLVFDLALSIRRPFVKAA